MLIPHFSYPFRFINDGRSVIANVVEQDSEDEIASNVVVLIKTPPGSREELPTFGVEEQTFSQQRPSVDEMAAQIEQWEPRADLNYLATVDAQDSLTARIRVAPDPRAQFQPPTFSEEDDDGA